MPASKLINKIYINLTIRNEYSTICAEVIRMEKRVAKIIIGAAGGTASKGSKTFKISIPSTWMKELGIDENKREVELEFDGENITLSRLQTMDNFAKKKLALGHDVRAVRYYNDKKLCTLIYADFTDKTLKAENHTDNLIKTAFGNRAFPLWVDFQTFLEERCIPRDRAGLREYLETIGMEEYNPIEIIKKTAGRMAEDNQWLEMEELK